MATSIFKEQKDMDVIAVEGYLTDAYLILPIIDEEDFINFKNRIRHLLEEILTDQAYERIYNHEN